MARRKKIIAQDDPGQTQQTSAPVTDPADQEPQESIEQEPQESPEQESMPTPDQEPEKPVQVPVVDDALQPSQVGELVVDTFETPEAFFVLSPIAGVNISDLDISIDEGMMVIKGNRTDPHGDMKKKYFHQECHWGAFSRKIVLADNVDIKAVQAQMNKGILTIKMPKIGKDKGEVSEA